MIQLQKRISFYLRQMFKIISVSMRAHFLLLPLLLCFCNLRIAVAQKTEDEFHFKDRYISSAGISYSMLNMNHRSEPLYGLCYSPSLNLLNKYSDFSIAAASHVSGSYHPKTKNDDANYFSFSVPAYLQFNFGHLATHDFYSSLGIYFGAGYNFCFVNSEMDGGVLLITAIRFWILQRSFTIGYSQTRLQNHNNLLHEVSLQINIGAYLSDVKKNNKVSKFEKPFRK